MPKVHSLHGLSPIPQCSIKGYCLSIGQNQPAWKQLRFAMILLTALRFVSAILNDTRELQRTIQQRYRFLAE
jgi:hypothetical protein